MKEEVMKQKGWALGIILLLSFSLTSVSTQNQTLSRPGQEIKDLMAAIGKVPPAIKEEALASLADQIKKDNAFLSSSFQAGHFKEMAKLYDDRHGVLSIRNYEIIYGKDSEAFWGKVWSQGKVLEFKLGSVFVRGLPALRKVTTTPPSAEEYDAVAFVANEIHLVQKDDQGSVIHNDTFYQDLAYRHNAKCVWYEIPSK
jgi:hypothetical protein